MTRTWITAAYLVLCGAAYGQTQVNMRSQSRNVDFSDAAFTKPFKSGTILPAACTVGETFFKTDALPGQNIYVCATTNGWLPGTSSVNTTNSGTGGIELLKTQPGATVTGRQALPGEGLVLTQQTDTVTVEADTAVVPRYATAGSAPSGACQTGRDIFTRTGGFPHIYTCVNDAWKPVWNVTSTLPATCLVGELVYHTDNKAIFGCTSANSWDQLTNAGGVDMTATGECFVTTSCLPVAANYRGTMPADAVAGKFAAVRVVIRDRVKLGKGMIFATDGATFTAFAAAIYADNNGVPGAKIAGTDVQFVDLAVAGYRHEVWGTGSVILTPNVYWIGFSSEDTAARFNFPGGQVVTATTMMGNLSSPAAVKCSSPITGNGITYVLPSTCGTATPWSAFGVDAPIIIASAQ